MQLRRTHRRRSVPGLVGLLSLLALAGCTGGSGRPPDSRILFLSDRDGDWSLYAMDAGGTAQRRVFRAPGAAPHSSIEGRGEALVSPDGRKVLLASRGLTVATIATGAHRRLGPGEGSSAAWSPDGRRIVFSGGSNRGLYVVDVRTGRRVTLLGSTPTWSPAWSPDGSRVAFAAQFAEGPVEVYAIRVDGKDDDHWLTRLTGYSPTYSSNLAWSRDDRLAFVGSRGDAAAHLVVVRMHPRRVVVLPRRLADGSVAWSPDGRRIAYSAATVRGASAIVTVGADGHGLRRLTPSRPSRFDASPVWTPDGESLLFVRTPLGGGAGRYVPQVWTMRADGSHQRPLTTAYPTGGGNLEPAWIRGSVHAEPAARTQQSRRGAAVVLRVPFPVDGIAAERGLAAIAPLGSEEQREDRPTAPILVWRPGQGRPARLAASPCGSVPQLAVAGSRLAFDCDNSYGDAVADSVWVADLRRRRPRVVFYGHAYAGSPGVYLDHVVGSGGTLAFGSASFDRRGRVTQRTLWRIDGLQSTAIRARPETGDVVAAGGGRLAAELADGRVAILRADGSTVRVLAPPRHRSRRPPPGQEPSFLLAGTDLLLLEHGLVQAYDTRTGKPHWRRRVPAGAHLESADGRLVVYTAGSSIHLLSDGRERLLRSGTRPHAALTADGLYYCFDVADRRYPGRVVFVPRAALPR